MPAWARSWLFGAFAGIALLFSAMQAELAFPFVLLVFVATVMRSHARAALGGGALIPTGSPFLYELRAAVERCAEMDRSPSGSCSTYGVNEEAIAMGLYVAVGLGLSAYGALRSREGGA